MRRFLGLTWIAMCCACQGAADTWTEPVTGMEFVRIEPGTTIMGSGPAEPADIRPAPPHSVTLSKPIFVARHEVTQAQWQRVMGSNPSQFRDCGPSCPVETVNWHEVQRFVERLRQMSGDAGLRLPTEAEWEFACRAGTDTPFSTGATLGTTDANFDGRLPYPGDAPGRFIGSPTPVGQYPPNPWGLYDMHGNVWEWTLDDYCPYPSTAAVDPVQQCGSGLKNIRGGSWYFSAASARCGRRFTHDPNDRGFSIGFRLVKEVS